MAQLTALFCRISSPVLCFMLMLQAAPAQTNKVAKQYNFSKVDEWLKDNLGRLGRRAVLVVSKDGKLLYSKAENDMSPRQKAATKFIAKQQGKDEEILLQDFSSTTRLRIASCSKWLSAALVMTFVDDGSLKLNDSIGKFLPVMTKNGKGNISIWQCLSHLTGIKAGNFKETNQATRDIKSMNEAMELIAMQLMEGPPGKTFHYSNAGLQIAAAVIEKISGRSFEELFQERIAKPCNMVNTDFGKGKVAMPAGGGWSTAEDYIKFLNMILNEGVYNGKRVLSSNSVAEMQKNRVVRDVKIIQSPAEAGSWGYGFGEWVMDDATGEKRSAAVTSPGLFGSFPWIDRTHDYAAFLLTFNINSRGRNELYTDLKRIIDGIVGK